MEDKNIIELYFSRSEDAVAATKDKYSPLCRRVARNILGSPEDSEECLNDTWLHLWNAIPPQKPESLGAYAVRVTRNLALGILRKRTAQKRKNGQYSMCLEELSECICDPSCAVSEDFVIKDALNSFLSELRPDARRIFVMRYWYVMSISDISKQLSVSEGSIKMSLMRTRESLRLYLKKEGIEI